MKIHCAHDHLTPSALPSLPLTFSACFYPAALMLVPLVFWQFNALRRLSLLPHHLAHFTVKFMIS